MEVFLHFQEFLFQFNSHFYFAYFSQIYFNCFRNFVLILVFFDQADFARRIFYLGCRQNLISRCHSPSPTYQVSILTKRHHFYFYLLLQESRQILLLTAIKNHLHQFYFPSWESKHVEEMVHYLQIPLYFLQYQNSFHGLVIRGFVTLVSI